MEVKEAEKAIRELRKGGGKTNAHRSSMRKMQMQRDW
jgi:hypothetical protein